MALACPTRSRIAPADERFQVSGFGEARILHSKEKKKEFQAMSGLAEVPEREHCQTEG
jgi:hypothetical protein